MGKLLREARAHIKAGRNEHDQRVMANRESDRKIIHYMVEYNRRWWAPKDGDEGEGGEGQDRNRLLDDEVEAEAPFKIGGAASYASMAALITVKYSCRAPGKGDRERFVTDEELKQLGPRQAAEGPSYPDLRVVPLLAEYLGRLRCVAKAKEGSGTSILELAMDFAIHSGPWLSTIQVDLAGVLRMLSVWAKRTRWEVYNHKPRYALGLPDLPEVGAQVVLLDRAGTQQAVRALALICRERAAASTAMGIKRAYVRQCELGDIDLGAASAQPHGLRDLWRRRKNKTHLRSADVRRLRAMVELHDKKLRGVWARADTIVAWKRVAADWEELATAWGWERLKAFLEGCTDHALQEHAQQLVLSSGKLPTSQSGTQRQLKKAAARACEGTQGQGVEGDLVQLSRTFERIFLECCFVSSGIWEVARLFGA